MLYKAYPLPVKFVCAFIYSDPAVYQQTKSIMERKFGRVDFESQTIDFNFTDYYEKEMGKNLTRRFIAFTKLARADNFVKIKDFCLKLEKKFAWNNKRIINIDPGYLTEAKLVLTTTKDFHHRIYIGKGIFAEVTLSFCKKENNFLDFPTTFPDYRTQRYKDILLGIRSTYKEQLKLLPSRKIN